MKNKLTPLSVLKVNPDYQLLVRGASIQCTKLDIREAAIPLQPLHLLLIETFLSAKNVTEAFQAFINSDLTKRLMGNVPENAVLSRIAELYSKDILIESPASSVSDSVAITMQSLKKTPVDDVYTGCYITHRNLAIHFAESGFIAKFSDASRDQKISINELFTLLAIGQAQEIEKSDRYKAPHIASEDHWEMIAGFITSGVIVKKQILETEDQTEKVEHESSSTAWQELEPEHNKTPIYFVPHTENHYPLALGLIYTAIQDYEGGDLLDKFQLIPIVYMNAEQFLSGPYKKFGPGVWLFSNYLWSSDTNMALSKHVKKDSKKNVTIHGGPSTPDYEQACEEFFAEHTSVDIAVHAEGEVAIAQILSAMMHSDDHLSYNKQDMSEIAGISFRDKKDGISIVQHTASRTRMADPNIIPSPYMAGVFDHYGSDVEAAIIETNRGCPFGCTFCDWGSAINQKVRRFDMDRVKEEIEWIARNKTKVLWIADANFGMLDRDVEVAQTIIDLKEQYGFPHEVVVNYTKNTTVRLVEIIKIFTEGGIISQGVISIQSMDAKTLEVIDRKNIKLSKYDELRKIFSDLKLPLSTDLMLGLPGTTMTALKNDLQHYIDADVPVKAYPTQLLPNSPMADPDYMRKYEIQTYDDGFLKSTYSYTEEDLIKMKGLYKTFTMADGYGLLRYVIRFLQWEYNIKAIDFIAELMVSIKDNPMQYPLLSYATVFFETEKSIPGGWPLFYGQLKNYILHKYSVSDDSALDTVLKVNAAVMPDEAVTYPMTIHLDHDIIQYFIAQQQKSDDDKPEALHTYAPGELVISDPDGMVNIDAQFLQYDSHQFFWELLSDVSRVRSAFTL